MKIRKGSKNQEVGTVAQVKKTIGQESPGELKRVRINEELLRVVKNLPMKKRSLCAQTEKFFEDYPDYVDPKSSFYRDQLKAKDKIEWVLSLYYTQMSELQKAFHKPYETLVNNPKEADQKTWRIFEEEYSGCGKEAELGLLLLTMGEAITNKKVKDWYFLRVLDIAQNFLNFGTIYGHLYAVGILKNLVASKQITGYQANELYALNNEVNRQAFAYNEALYRRGSFNLAEFLESHEDIKKGFTERISQFIEEVRVRR